MKRHISAAIVVFSLCSSVRAQCTVDWNNVHQRIDGFGASSAFSGINWSQAQANMFFSTNTGAGLSLIRTQIQPGGTITSSELGIAQKAQALGASVWSSPWTPQISFKDSGTFNGGDFVSSNNQAYANQLAGYVATMKNTQGISLYAISVQNEPDFTTTSYASCAWTAQQFHDFVPYLYNALVASNVASTKIIIPESENWQSNTNLYSTAMNDTNVAADVGIIADHNYDGPNFQTGSSAVPAALPVYGKAMWETEVSTGDAYDGSITNAMYWAGRIHLFMTAAQANAWHYWWLISGNSDNEGLTDTSGNPAKRMYVLGNYARFVRPNYYRIDATNGTDAQITAYKNSSGNFAIVAINGDDTNLNQTFILTNCTVVGTVTPWITSSNLSLVGQTPVGVTNSAFTYSLPAMSVVTFVGQTIIITNFNVTPATTFNSRWNLGGPFSPSSQVYTLTNTDTIPLVCSVTHTSNWLTVPTTATNLVLNAGSGTNITVFITNSLASSLSIGTYTDILGFSNTATGVTLPRNVSLSVAPAAWTNANASGNWSGLFNWNSATVPDLGSSVVFGSAGATCVVDSVSRTVGTITFSGSDNFSVAASGGAGLTINSALTVASQLSYLMSAPVVLGGGNTWFITNGATLNVSGPITATNSLTMTGGGTLILSGSAFVTNSLGNGVLEVRGGRLSLNGGTIMVNQLVLTNGVNSVFTFNAGALNSGGTYVTNNQLFAFGDGSDAATFELNGGVHSFANNLEIRNNATLTGCGTVTGTVVVDPGGKILANCGGTLSFSGTVTNNGSIIATNGTTIDFFGPVAGSGTITHGDGNVQYFVAINTSSSPPSGGSTTGAGIYSVGSNITVCATVNSCYDFVNWTVNGTAVSTSTCYTFIVAGNETLVANFAPFGGLAIGSLTSLWSFADGSDGANPAAGLVQGSDGNFYGTTYGSGSGASSYGNVFRITPSGGLTNLHSFTGSDGANPSAGLVQGSDSNFYGTTYQGGTNGFGTVFRISPAGNLTNLWEFANGLDGAYSYATLAQGSDGNFYGTTYGSGSGASSYGNVFRITPSGGLTNLHSFTGSDGANPSAGLVQGSDSNFYGTTYQGGTNGFGTVFRISPAGNLTNLWEFANGLDGAYSYATLAQGSDGNFYGTTSGSGSGPSAYGTVFRISPGGGLTNLWEFIDCGDGATPYAGLVQGSDGNFYGTTTGSGSGPSGHGNAFQITPNGSLAILWLFTGANDGANPYAPLVQGSDGNFYGTTYQGGTNGYGVAFRLSVSLNSPANQISGIKLTGINVVVTIPSVAHETYQLQYRGSLTLSNWSNVSSASMTNSIGGLLSLTNFGGALQPQGFYRFDITP